MDKRYIFLPRELFRRMILGVGRGNLVVRCPACRNDVSTSTFWTETGELGGQPTTLSFVECPHCAISMYPAGGSFTIPDPENAREREEDARASMQLFKWWQWKDKRTSQERGRV